MNHKFVTFDGGLRTTSRGIPGKVAEMPVTGQRLRDVMPGDGTDSEESDQAKDEANAGEGEGGQAV